MQTKIKRFSGLRLLLILLIFSVFLINAEASKASAKEQEKLPYLIKVNREFNTITIYKMDDKGEYSEPVKAMICSVGANDKTITGTFQTKGKYRWKELMGEVWGQYSTRIEGGILFHSVYYYDKKDPASLAVNQFNKLGTAVSHGCVRLSVKDAKWIYDNCATGTTVVIYDDKESAGPLGKPEAIKITSDLKWDPTDPDKNNPYLTKQPKITGVKNIKINWSEKVDLSKTVRAKSTLGVDITSKVTVSGEVDNMVAGKYKVTYTVTDELEKTTEKTITVTVKECTQAPELTGIKDKIVGADVLVNRKFALSGVKAYCSNIKLDKDSIEVKIEKVSESEYYITYAVRVGKGPTTTAEAKIIVDNEAPIITGITDMTLEAEKVLDEEYLLSLVSVSDNYTLPENIIVNVSYVENPDGTYLVTYEATDEKGNQAVEQAVISY